MSSAGGIRAYFRRWTLDLGLWTCAVALAAACHTSSTFDVAMQDSSMEPTFAAHSMVRFRPASGAGRGQVIAFEYPLPYPGRPRRELIARVIGLADDRIELSSSGVTVNGERLHEPYAKNQERVSFAALTVPARTYFVLGDDRANQHDSRWWGPLPASKLLGVAEPAR